MRLLTDSAMLRPVGGIEICVLEDATALAERHHRVDVLFGEDGEQRPAYERAGVGLTGPVRFRVSRARFLRDALEVLPVLRAARRLRPDVVWLNRSEHLLWGALVARASGVRLVCHLHHRPAGAYVRWTIRGAQRFIAVSRFTKGQWVAAGIPADRIEVVHNALPPGRYPAGGDAELLRARAALGLPPTGRVVTFYGRFGEEKGLPTVLEAFDRLGRDDTTLLLAGFWPTHIDATALRARVAALGDRVVVVPPSQDVVPFLHAADVVVSPSWVEEAFGRSIIEGMSTGRPVIASRIGAMTEVLEGGMERMLVPTRDADALLAALRAVLDWRDAEPELGDACRAWVAERFPYRAHLDRLEAILLEESRA